MKLTFTAISLLAAVTLGSAAFAADKKSDYHDPDSNTQHVGRTTQPAMGSKASEPTKTDYHDPDSNTQHVGRKTEPAMGSKASDPTKTDYHDPDSNTVHVNKK